MAKQSGLGSGLFMAQYDLSGDIGSIQSIVTERGLFDVSSISVSGTERIMGLRSGSIDYTAFWNIAAGQAHPSLAAMPRTDQMTTVAIGSTVGNAAASMIGKQVSYAPTRGADGSLVATISAQSNANAAGGLEWGELLTTGKQTFASGTLNGTSINLGAVSTLFGAAGYLHVFSLGSGSPTVTIADSANDSTFTPITGLAFTTITGVVTERLQTGLAATIRQYVRVQVTGTYTNLVCLVNFVRYTETQAT